MYTMHVVICFFFVSGKTTFCLGSVLNELHAFSNNWTKYTVLDVMTNACISHAVIALGRVSPFIRDAHEWRRRTYLRDDQIIICYPVWRAIPIKCIVEGSTSKVWKVNDCGNDVTLDRIENFNSATRSVATSSLDKIYHSANVPTERRWNTRCWR